MFRTLSWRTRLLDGAPDALGRRGQVDMRHSELTQPVHDSVGNHPSAGVIPPSPPPRRPSGCVVDGTSLMAVANIGRSVARGIA